MRPVGGGMDAEQLSMTVSGAPAGCSFRGLLLASACTRQPASSRRGARDPAGDRATWRRRGTAAISAATWPASRIPTSCSSRAASFQRDWQGTLDHYIRDYGGDPERRGRLHFFDIRVEMLGPDAAQLISRYRLEGGERPQDGINTRLMRKVDGRWVIALNHVSSAEVPASVSEGAEPATDRR